MWGVSPTFCAHTPERAVRLCHRMRLRPTALPWVTLQGLQDSLRQPACLSHIGMNAHLQSAAYISPAPHGAGEVSRRASWLVCAWPPTEAPEGHSLLQQGHDALLGGGLEEPRCLARMHNSELYPRRKAGCVPVAHASVAHRAGAERGGGACAAGSPGQDAQPAVPPGGEALAPGQDQVQGLPPPRPEGCSRQGGYPVLDIAQPRHSAYFNVRQHLSLARALVHCRLPPGRVRGPVPPPMAPWRVRGPPMW